MPPSRRAFGSAPTTLRSTTRGRGWRGASATGKDAQKIDEIARRAFPPAAPSPVSPGGDDASVGGGGGDDDSYSLDEVPPAMEDLDDIVI